MAIPHSYMRRFEISGVTFMHYFAQDAHGTVVNDFSVNGQTVNSNQFYSAIQKSVGDAEYYIGVACGLVKSKTPDWSGSE